MTIGELAKRTGCEVVTIRYYEKRGLLKKPGRSKANYRLYSEEDVERLRFIRHCRQHDMSLAEIGDLLRFRDVPAASCDWISTLVDGHIAALEKRIAALEELKGDLAALRCRCDGGKGADCGILRSLAMREHCAHCQRATARGEKAAGDAAGAL